MSIVYLLDTIKYIWYNAQKGRYVKIIYKGEVVNSEKGFINGKPVINTDRFDRFEYLKERKTWSNLKIEMLIPVDVVKGNNALHKNR